MLVVAGEANTPVTDPQAELARRNTNEAYHIPIPVPRKSHHRVDHAALHGRVEPLQVSSCAR